MLDLEDGNWEEQFTEVELEEISSHFIMDDIDELPSHMQHFIDNVPVTDNILEIFTYVSCQFVNPETDPDLYWLKSTLESVASMFITKYLPITDQQERDLIRRVWNFIDIAYDSSILKFRSEKQCRGSKVFRNKKRKISAVDIMGKQLHGQIPDMLIFYDKWELGMAEVAKEEANTKEVVEGGKKSLDIMNSMFLNVVDLHPLLQCEMKITGYLISKLKLTPMELSNPFGYVKVVKRGNGREIGKNSERLKSLLIPPFFFMHYI